MTEEHIRILVVDDDEKILFAFREVFKTEGYTTITATNGLEAIAEITANHPSVVFMDITMPEMGGLEALQQVRKEHAHLPVILITGFGTMHVAIKAMQLGAFDYLTKPLDIGKIRSVTEKALHSLRAKASSHAGSHGFGPASVTRYEIIGDSQQMQEIYKLIGSISTTPNHTSVLILGESGTGKELVARALHANGTHAAEPFIPINCTALPETLLESELFGHEKGSFTGATERKIGKFELARDGTIFLDEIGTLSLHLQQKLLRVLQEREFERLGGNTPIRVDARFVAATNYNLPQEVKKQSFREDLYFRLNVVALQLPPLRERQTDISLLANYFIAKYNTQLNKSVRGFSEEAMALLQAYAFPGNVRELENFVERALLLTKGELIMPDVLKEIDTAPASAVATDIPIVSKQFDVSRSHVIESFERQFVIRQLEEYTGNVTLAAKSSGMTRQNFQRLMKKYSIEASSFRK